MAKRYEDILEMQFNLAYYNVLTAAEYDTTDVKDLDWLYGRLLKQKKDEAKVARKAITGKDEIEG
jgi:hypothetical protein